MAVANLQATRSTTTPAVISSPDYSELRQLVRKRLEVSDDADPTAATLPLLDDLPADLLRLAAQKGLWAIAGEVTRVSRNPRGATLGTTPGLASPPTSAKWDNVAFINQTTDVFHERVFTGEDWKLLGDCTKADLRGAAEHTRGNAAGLLKSADKYDALGRRLKKDQTVSDLDRPKVEGIFYA